MYLLIGGTSFIAAHTVDEFLSRGEKIAVTCRNESFNKHYSDLGVPVYNLDLRDKEAFDKLPGDFDGIILLGGLLPANATADLVHEENAADYFAVNTIGTINVLEFARRNGINRVISTCSYADVAGAWKKDYAIKEDEPRNYGYSGDHAVYVFSKNAACDTMEYYNRQYGMKNAWFRLPPVYGVGPHGSLKVNGKTIKSGLQIFMEKAARGEDISVFGDPQLSRDVVYVKDVAKAFYQAMKSDKTYGLYNMTSGRGITLEDQAKIIAKVFAREENGVSKVVYEPGNGNNTPSFLFSIEKAANDFGYEPEYGDFEKMMEDYKKDYYDGKFKELFHYEDLI